MADFGVKVPPDYTEIESYVFKRWLNSIVDWIKTHTTIVTVTTAYTIISNVFYVRADATAGAFAVTLPAALNLQGRQILIKKIDSSANAITVTAAGSDTIEGAATSSLAAQWNKTLLISNGNTSWEKIV